MNRLSLKVQVIAYTILDINRTTRLNERPMTPEQHQRLREMAKEIEAKSGSTDGQLSTECPLAKEMSRIVRASSPCR